MAHTDGQRGSRHVPCKLKCPGGTKGSLPPSHFLKIRYGDSFVGSSEGRLKLEDKYPLVLAPIGVGVINELIAATISRCFCGTEAVTAATKSVQSSSNSEFMASEMNSLVRYSGAQALRT